MVARYGVNFEIKMGGSPTLVKAARNTSIVLSPASLLVIIFASLFHYSHGASSVLRLSECVTASEAESLNIGKLCTCMRNDQQSKTFTCGNGSESLGDLFKAVKPSVPSPLGFLNSDVKMITITGNASDLHNEVRLQPAFFSGKHFEKIRMTNLQLAISERFIVKTNLSNRLGIFRELSGTLTSLNFTNAGVDAIMLQGHIKYNEDIIQESDYKIIPALVVGLPNLKELILDMNVNMKVPVSSSVSEPDGAELPVWFKGLSGLELLSLAGNDLSNWTMAMKTESPLKKLGLARHCFGNVNNFLTGWGSANSISMQTLEELDFSSRDPSNSPPTESCPPHKATSFPSDFCARFPGIKRVVMRHSELELRNDTDHGSWQNCQSLQELDFSFAKSIKINSDVLSRIVPQVKILRFRGSRVMELHGPVFRRLNLPELDLTSVLLSGVGIPRDIFSESSVNLLKLSKNNLTTLEPEILAPLSSSLRVLDLSWNPLLNVNAVIKNLTNLNSVILSDMQLANIPGDTFTSINTIEKIDLSRNKLVLLDDTIFPNSSNIKEIILRSNSLTRIPSSVKQPNIVNLDLSNNQLTTFPEDLVDFFSKLDSNRAISINLANNPWNCSCSLSKLNLWLRDGKGYERVCNATGTGNCPVCATPTVDKLVYLNDKDFFSVCTPTTTVQPGQSSAATAGPTGTGSPFPTQSSPSGPQSSTSEGSVSGKLFSSKLNSWLTVMLALGTTFAAIR